MLPDLNLLRVFQALLAERSVTRAGARLGLSQSAVSHALARLRHALDDELFVRGPAGMQPTARALDVGARIQGALDQLQSALTPADFDPSTTDRQFSLATGAYAAAVVGPPLVSQLAELAPNAELAIGDRYADLADVLDTRQADFAIASVVAAPQRFACEPLLTEALTWVVSAGSPLAQRKRVDLEALAATPHIVIGRPPFGPARDGRRGVVMRSSWEDPDAFEMALASRGLSRRVAVIVPDSYSALAVASRSQMATLIPRRLALAVAGSRGLKLIDPPYESPPAEISLLYLRERLQEPPINWLRQLLRAVADDL